MQRHRDPLAESEPLIRRVYSYAMYRLGNETAAEDVTSETLLRAVRYRRSYKASVGTPHAWLLGIARRVIAEHLAVSAGERALVSGDGEVVDDSASALQRLELRAALATLSQQERDLLALRYGGDLAVKEVARLLGERTNTVEVALHRVVAKLRAQLAPESSVREGS
jgi:RNA polymerase sigma-70 factor (ECF subfamily)